MVTVAPSWTLIPSASSGGRRNLGVDLIGGDLEERPSPAVCRLSSAFGQGAFGEDSPIWA